MQALIEVVLRNGDVVVELTGNRTPDRVDCAECRIALAKVVDDDAHREDIVDLREVRVLPRHLLVDRVQVLRATRVLCLDSGALQLRTEHVDRPSHIVGPSIATHVDESGELVVALWFQRLEREVLQLPLHLPDPQSLCERRIDLERLMGDPALLLDPQGGKRSHVVESVSELDQDDTDVLRHRQEHLADVLGVLLLGTDRRELAQLRDAVDERRHLVPEAFRDRVVGDTGVLWHVVQEGRGECRRVETEIGEDDRRLCGMGHVGLAGGTNLLTVRAHGEVEGVGDQRRRRGIGAGFACLLQEPPAQLSNGACERTNLGDRVRSRRNATAVGGERLRFYAHVC